MENKTIYNMKRHEQIMVGDDNFNVVVVLRVPGGWIYTTFDRGSVVMGSCFVPYDNEFQNEVENGK